VEQTLPHWGHLSTPSDGVGDVEGDGEEPTELVGENAGGDGVLELGRFDGVYWGCTFTRSCWLEF